MDTCGLYYEQIEAMIKKNRPNRWKRFALLWKRQLEPEMERLRLRACALLLASSAIWILAMIFVAPHIYR